MSDWKDMLAMPDAPGSFAEAIRAGGAQIRRYELKRRRITRAFSVAAAALLLVAAGVFAALRDRQPHQDSVYLAPDATGTPAPGRETAKPSAAPAATPTAAPTATPEPGALLYGGEGYKLSEACAAGLPETPSIRFPLYRQEKDELDADTVAGWLWGDDYRKEEYDSSVVYIHEAAKKVQGDFKAKAYVTEGDYGFFWAPDDPSKLYAGSFESREAALEWAEKWLRQYIPAEYFGHPFHPGTYYFDGRPVNTAYSFHWDTQVEGVAVRGGGLRGDICTFGPSFFMLDMSRYVPEEESGPAPIYLTAAQALDALNWAARLDMARRGTVDPQMYDSAFGTFEDTVETIRPVFANHLFYRDDAYRLSWEITVRSAERGSVSTFTVDAETGRLWNDHEGEVLTIYSQDK